MVTVSLCMIVKNEEEALHTCLKSVHDLVDEIIIVDTGSTDRTQEVAAASNARIYNFEWCDDFSAARNYAFDQATQEYQFWLDADDILEEKDRLSFLNWKKQATLSYDSITMDYVLSVDEQGQPLYKLKRNRIVRRDRRFRWTGFVHEFLNVTGSIFHSNMAVTHNKTRAYTDRNLHIYLKHREQGTVFSERDHYYFANELYDNGRTLEAIQQYEHYLGLNQGWIEDRIAACFKLADCYNRQGQKQEQRMALLRTLTLDVPRAQFCCAFGNLFIEDEQYAQAIYWFRQATLIEPSQDVMALTNSSYYTWFPHLQLCLCYDRIGDIEKARSHHRIAQLHHPAHPSVLYNEQYFAQLEQQK
ncbi:glycosyltransferase [Paenibacillus polymyxa]|uniref:glycosyltransferase n=1 Tax=Paenibacillus polymyxa TaxID=1406 RepID=UPI0007E9ACA2|nr:glycosyltransferase [Paenibacillus polymyxa]OAZ41924.1 glycosyl transferase [Paenibacillus polymyxa]